MKVNDKTMADALDAFSRNPFWRKIYDEAPEAIRLYRLAADRGCECAKEACNRLNVG